MMREQELYIEAMMRSDPEDRRRFLDDACRDDDALRERIEKLLRHAEDVGSFLESSPPALVAAGAGRPPNGMVGTVAIGTISVGTVTVGDRIGPYKLLEQIGEGGFGVVFMAEQTAPVKRRVALKVIKPGITQFALGREGAGQVVARFEAERQALAMMDHPNIARVLDAGATEEGRPYFVMELVNGIPITDFCDGAQLTPKERLELFVTVCRAVQHAHQKGIIHRDIKPTNVLVTLHDGKPVVKVIDFGIAKATGEQLTEKTLFTGFAQLLGTPPYMSPEQAAMSGLDIDTRSDVYSLGVLLYELLTGTTPFDKARLQQAAFDEVRRIIREEEPQKPSTRLSELGSSRPPSGVDQRAEGSSAPTTTLAAIAALRRTEPRKLSQLVKGELDWIVMKALEKDRGRRYETASGLAADVERHLTGEAVSACPPSSAYRLRKFSRRHRKSLLAAALVGVTLLVVAGGLGWWIRDEAARHGRNAEAVAALLERCEEALRADRADQAALAFEAAERRAADGGTEQLCGRLARCRADIALLRELDAIDTLRWTYHENQIPGAKGGAAQWPVALATIGVRADASRAGEVAERVSQSLIQSRLLTALDSWLASDPTGEEERTDVRAVLQAADPAPYRDAVRDAIAARDGRALTELAATTEALEQPARFAVVFGELDDVPPDRRRQILERALWTRPGDLGILLSLGLSYATDSAPEARGELVRWYQAAVSAHPTNILARNNLGVALAHSGRPDDAIKCYREAIRLDPNYALSHYNLGINLAGQGDVVGAIACFREAIRRNPQDTMAYSQLASVLDTSGDTPGAIEAYREAIRIDPDDRDAYMGLGAILCDVERDYDGAIAAFEEAIRILPENAPAHLNLGNATRGKGDKAGAVVLYRKAIELDPNYADAYVNLGGSLEGEENAQERLAAYREALRIDPNHAIAHANLGASLSDSGDTSGAIAEYRRAMELDPRNPVTRRNVVRDLQRAGDIEGVAEVHRSSIANDPDRADAHNDLAWLLATGPEGLRDGEQAVAHATRACELTGWQEPGYIDTLAAAHGEAGDFAEAVDLQKKALEFPAFEAIDGDGGRQRLELYVGQKAFRDPAFFPPPSPPPPDNDTQ